MREILKVLGVAAIFALFLSACASPPSPVSPTDAPSEMHEEEMPSVVDDHGDDMHEDGEETHGHEEVAERIAGAPEVGLEAGEFYFNPEELHFRVGDSVNFVVVNVGVIEHEMSIPELDFELGHFESGETVVGGITFTKPGTYTIGCYLPGHFEAGMKAMLVVDEAS